MEDVAVTKEQQYAALLQQRTGITKRRTPSSFEEVSTYVSVCYRGKTSQRASYVARLYGHTSKQTGHRISVASWFSLIHYIIQCKYNVQLPFTCGLTGHCNGVRIW